MQGVVRKTEKERKRWSKVYAKVGPSWGEEGGEGGGGRGERGGIFFSFWP